MINNLFPTPIITELHASRYHLPPDAASKTFKGLTTLFLEERERDPWILLREGWSWKVEENLASFNEKRETRFTGPGGSVSQELPHA